MKSKEICLDLSAKLLPKLNLLEDIETGSETRIILYELEWNSNVSDWKIDCLRRKVKFLVESILLLKKAASTETWIFPYYTELKCQSLWCSYLRLKTVWLSKLENSNPEWYITSPEPFRLTNFCILPFMVVSPLQSYFCSA
jgi:hypothetical protein